MLVVLVVAAMLVVQGQLRPSAVAPSSRPGSTNPASGEVGPTASPVPTLAVPPVVAVGRTATFDPRAVKAPTDPSEQSKVWFAQGSWWGLLRNGADELHVDRFDWGSLTWTDTGTLVDERPSARADALWDGTHLLIATSPGSSDRAHGLRFLRFTYDPAAERYTLDPDYPVLLTAAGVDVPLLSRDSRGVLWVTYLAPSGPGAPSGAGPSPSAPATSGPARPSPSPGTTATAPSLGGLDDAIWSLHTLGDALHWTAPVRLSLGPSTGEVTQYAAFASGAELDLAWTSRVADEVYTARHADGAPPDAWTVTSSPLDGAAGSTQGISLRTLAGDPQRRLFVGLVDALDRQAAADPLWVKTVLLVVGPDGTSRTYAFGLIQDHHADPVLLIDPLRRRLYFLATAPSAGGAVVMKSTNIDDIAFAGGLGDPLVASPPDPAVDGPTSTKQDLTEASGVLVLAADAGTGHYVEAAMNLGGTPPGRSTGSPSPTPDLVGVSNALIDDTFDDWAAGDGVPNGWVLQAGQGILRVAASPSPSDHSAMLETVDAGTRARMCKSVPTVAATTLVASSTVSVGHLSTGAATALALRGGGHEVAAVRFGGRGMLSYLAGTAVLDSTTPYRATVWYRINLTVHLPTRTYDLQVQDLTSDRLILAVRGVRLATSGPAEVNGICFATSSGASGLSLFVARVSLIRP